MSQVERHVGPMRFCIVIHERAPAPDGRAVPTTFTASCWNAASDALTRTHGYLDACAQVGGMLLPWRRRVVTADDGGLTTRELRLRDLRLLEQPTPPEATGGVS